MVNNMKKNTTKNLILNLLAVTVVLNTGLSQAKSVKAPIHKVVATNNSQKVEHYFTSNGIEVILKKITTNDVIGMKVFIKGGSRNINDKNAGIEKLLLNSMLLGSKEFPKSKLNLELAKIGAQLGTDSFFDYSSFGLKSVDKYFDKALYMFQTLVNNPLLDKNELELEKGKMLTTIKYTIDNPDDYVWKVANKSFSMGHPYLNDFAGELTTIPSINQDALKAYKKNNLIGSKMLIVIAGNYKDGIKKDLEKYFGKIAKGDYKNPVVPMIPVNKSSVSVENRDIPTAYVAGRFTAPSLKDADYPAMYLGLRILSEKFSESVRTKHGLSYAVSSGSSMRAANSGYVYVTTIKPKESIALMNEEINILKTKSVDATYLNGVRNLYYTSYFIGLEPNLEQANTLGVNQLIAGDYNNSYKLIERFKKVTPQDIIKAANKYIKNINYGIIYQKDKIDIEDFNKI